MFKIIEKNHKFVNIVLVAVIATFVLWGIGGYLGADADDGAVAKVGSKQIYLRDVDNAMSQGSGSTDKTQVLFQLINRQLLINNIQHYKMQVTTGELQEAISQIKDFQNPSGQFDLNKYKQFLDQSFMTVDQFQNNITQQILINDWVDLFQKNFIGGSELFNQQFAILLSRQRSVASYVIDKSQFYSKIQVTESQIHQYYQQHLAQWTIPDKVKIQYLVLDQFSAIKNIKLSEAVINQYIKVHQADVDQQINVSHILFAVPQDATAATRNKIQMQAQNVLNILRANPSKFASLAKQYSQDPGSSKLGGNLGIVKRGTMVKPFEDAAFKLQIGQISDLVTTQYGYHIIKLNGRAGNSPADLREYAISQLQKQQSVIVVQKMLDQLNTLTYNNPLSLIPASKTLGLPLQSSLNWIARGQTTTDIFSNAKVQQAMFSNDVLQKHDNSTVINLTDGTYIVLRVIAYNPTIVQSQTMVNTQILQQIKQDGASKMAVDDGQRKLSRLTAKPGQLLAFMFEHNRLVPTTATPLNLPFGPSEDISLLGHNPHIDNNAVGQIFSTKLESLPAYTSGIDELGNFVIYKITGEHIDKQLSEQNTDFIKQLNSADKDGIFSAYVQSLSDNYPITYKLDRLNIQAQNP